MKARVCWVFREYPRVPMQCGPWVDYERARDFAAYLNGHAPHMYHFLDLRHGASA